MAPNWIQQVNRREILTAESEYSQQYCLISRKSLIVAD